MTAATIKIEIEDRPFRRFCFKGKARIAPEPLTQHQQNVLNKWLKLGQSAPATAERMNTTAMRVNAIIQTIRKKGWDV